MTDSILGATHNALRGAPAWLALVQQKVSTLRFGVVQIVVHDGKVVQISRTEKTRFEGDTERR